MIWVNKYTKVLMSIILVGLVSTLYSQGLYNYQSQPAGFKLDQKPQLSVDISTSFWAIGNGNNLFSTSVLPKVKYPLNSKISVSAGLGYTSLFHNQPNSGSSTSSLGHIFVSGDYLLNEKVTLRGTAYGTFYLGNNHITQNEYQTGNDFSSKGVIMDVEYRVTDNFQINVGFEYRQQNMPNYPYLNGVNGNNLMLNNSFMNPNGFNFNY